jgi:hypothetical protein
MAQVAQTKRVAATVSVRKWLPVAITISAVEMGYSQARWRIRELGNATTTARAAHTAQAWHRGVLVG